MCVCVYVCVCVCAHMFVHICEGRLGSVTSESGTIDKRMSRPIGGCEQLCGRLFS